MTKTRLFSLKIEGLESFILSFFLSASGRGESQELEGGGVVSCCRLRSKRSPLLSREVGGACLLF